MKSRALATELVRGQTESALRLTKEVLSKHSESNAVLSPLSIHVLLSIVAAGAAEGPAKEQFLALLRSKSSDQLNAYASQVIDTILANDPTDSAAPKLFSVNGVWLDQSQTYKASFKRVVDEDYKTVSKSVDFQNKASEVKKEIIAWVLEETRGLIKSSPNINSSTLIFLANAVYFKAAWADPFEVSDTKDFDFYLLDGSSVRAPFMRSWANQAIAAFDGFKVHCRQYERSEDPNRVFTMYFYLPDKRDGLHWLRDRLCSEPGFVDRYKPAYGVSVRQFRIPKFKISFGFSVTDVMSSLGVKLEGMAEAMEDYCGVGDMCVNHKAFIKVDEVETEAAGYTSADEVGCSLDYKEPEYIDFVADHPFIFLIREEITGVVVFIGQVLDPLKEDKNP